MRHRLSRSRGFSRLPGVEIGSSLCLSGWHLPERAEPEDRELRARGEGAPELNLLFMLYFLFRTSLTDDDE